jgi:hypothetical protein
MTAANAPDARDWPAFGSTRLSFETQPVDTTFSMKKPSNPLDEPGPQVFWKVTLTIVCVVAGGLGALHLFGVL